MALRALGATPDLPVLATVLAGLAMIALAGGDAKRSAVLFGAADAAHPGWRADAGPPRRWSRRARRRARTSTPPTSAAVRRRARTSACPPPEAAGRTLR
ncbi:hypothetical protein [Microbispora sp. GKU 823]|uniref:hypothetical protein n=1 Tax=Microbispora sp. GKU 823 TaxID=1652100 RepID=UPI0011806BC0|nr:hypothetical protein [Microbispora sp. GKU 823]